MPTPDDPIPEVISQHLQSCGFAPPFRRIEDTDFGSLWLVQRDSLVLPFGSSPQMHSGPNLVEWAGAVKGGSLPDCLLTFDCDDLVSAPGATFRYLPHTSIALSISDSAREHLKRITSNLQAVWDEAHQRFVDTPVPSAAKDFADFQLQNIHVGDAGSPILLIGQIGPHRLEWEMDESGAFFFTEFN